MITIRFRVFKNSNFKTYLIIKKKNHVFYMQNCGKKYEHIYIYIKKNCNNFSCFIFLYSYDEDMRIIQQRISNKKLNQLMVDFECESQVADAPPA
jgi:hypothetical protein